MRFPGAALVAIGVAVCGARAAAAEQPICPDRPGKATPACTVPADQVQIETSLFDWSFDHSDGVRTDTYAIASTALKYGLTDRWTIEADISPCDEISTGGNGIRGRASGFGDLYLRTKYRLTNDDNPVQVALYPFVKLPTAPRSIGNGKIESGISVPIQYAIPHSTLGLDFAPEVDATANSDGSGYHPALIGAASLSDQLNPRLSISAELWSAWDFDPAGTTRQYSLDGSVAWLATNDVQLDGGANLGLNRNTPDLELYTGLSVRF